jgi:hypothetical protein
LQSGYYCQEFAWFSDYGLQRLRFVAWPIY